VRHKLYLGVDVDEFCLGLFARIRSHPRESLVNYIIQFSCCMKAAMSMRLVRSCIFFRWMRWVLPTSEATHHKIVFWVVRMLLDLLKQTVLSISYCHILETTTLNCSLLSIASLILLYSALASLFLTSSSLLDSLTLEMKN
jgi:hypothetical protein